jgi:hypothetical protein
MLNLNDLLNNKIKINFRVIFSIQFYNGKIISISNNYNNAALRI